MTADDEEPEPPRDRRREIALLIVLAVIFCVGVLPIALVLSRPHNLYGLTEYDDGVYFAASLRLVSGIFPYKDFVLVQPPGIAVVLAPFAALSHLIGTRHALAGARILTALVAGTNAALVGYLLRHRGLLAVAVGGLALAVFPTGYTAVHAILLEPYCVLFCLLGACAIFSGDEIASDRRCAIAGACFGFAGAVKVFAVVPLLIVLVLLLVARRRAAVALIAGVAAAVVVFVLPFFLVAPGGFVHDVIASQLGRSTVRPTPLINRVFALTGLAYSSPTIAAASTHSTIPSLPAGALPTWLAGGSVSAVLAALGVSFGWRGERRAFACFVVVCAIGASAIALVPAVYYDHYAYFSAPFLALSLGLGACLVVRGVRACTDRLSRTPRLLLRRTALAGAFVLLATGSSLALMSSTAYQRSIVDKFGDAGPAVAATVPEGGCTISDAEGLLVSAGRADPGPPGCPSIIDSTGTWLSLDPLHPPVRAGTGVKSPKLVAVWSNAFHRVDDIVLSGVCAFRIPWTPALYAYVDTHFSTLPGPYGGPTGLAFGRGAPTSAKDTPNLAARCAATRKTS